MESSIIIENIDERANSKRWILPLSIIERHCFKESNKYTNCLFGMAPPFEFKREIEYIMVKFNILRILYYIKLAGRHETKLWAQRRVRKTSSKHLKKKYPKVDFKFFFRYNSTLYQHTVCGYFYMRNDGIWVHGDFKSIPLLYRIRNRIFTALSNCMYIKRKRIRIPHLSQRTIH